MASLEKE